MARFAAGVTVVTTTDCSGVMYGVTVGSFNSVSLDPPLVLFSIEKASSRFKAFSECDRFIVNVLSDEQKRVSQDFAEKGADCWSTHNFDVVEGMPVIRGAITYFRCALYHLYDGGDHKIVVGKVLECKTLSDKSPLLYYRSKYWALDKEV